MNSLGLVNCVCVQVLHFVNIEARVGLLKLYHAEVEL